MRRSAAVVIAVLLGAVVAGGLMSSVAHWGQQAAMAQEVGAEDLAYFMSQTVQPAQALVADLALADREKVQQRAEQVAANALRIAELEPRKHTEDLGTYKYLAYSAHVHALQVGRARSPKTAQEKYGELLGTCVECHHLFRD